MKLRLMLLNLFILILSRFYNCENEGEYLTWIVPFVSFSESLSSIYLFFRGTQRVTSSWVLHAQLLGSRLLTHAARPPWTIHHVLEEMMAVVPSLRGFSAGDKRRPDSCQTSAKLIHLARLYSLSSRRSRTFSPSAHMSLLVCNGVVVQRSSKID